jgi:oligogalacturonide lyase
MLNANAAGDTLVFATVDETLFAERSARAFAGEQFPDELFFQQTASSVHRVDAASGFCEEVLRLERFWINHVLVNPRDRDLIEFCHEYTPGSDRMWLLNAATGEHAPVSGQGPDEWYQHEFWSPDGERLYFHGGLVGDERSGFCGWCTAGGRGYQKFGHDTPGRSYAHYNLHPDGQAMVADGEMHPGCISRVWLQDGRQEFEVLCRHDSYRYGDDQRCHPHPSFTPDGRQVVFTSNVSGSSNVYLTAWV